MTEEIVETPQAEQEITQDDKLWAALSWLPWVGPLLAIIALLVEPQKDRAFVRFHAVQALAANVILFVISFVISFTGILLCIAPLIYLATIYPAVKAYQGEWLELPWLTEFCKNQGWI